MNKILATLKQRKTWALALSFFVPVVNKLFALNLDLESVIELMVPFIMWASIEGYIDGHRSPVRFALPDPDLEGCSDEALRAFASDLATASNKVLKEIQAREKTT